MLASWVLRKDLRPWPSKVIRPEQDLQDIDFYLVPYLGHLRELVSDQIAAQPSLYIASGKGSSALCLRGTYFSQHGLTYMAVFWVQQYFSLPVIHENLGMGDELYDGRHPFVTTEVDNELGMCWTMDYTAL